MQHDVNTIMRLLITGAVAAQSSKTKAEEILKRVKGIKSIDNQIQVITPVGV